MGCGNFLEPVSKPVGAGFRLRAQRFGGPP
jgi:hypothetical protein